ncbi:hypothetical protein ACS0TY_027323 [Phlomoides rotata]
MRIFIHTPTGKNFPLEAERSDTIYHVKGLIKEKEGICRWEQVLVSDGLQLEDSKTLADHCIENESNILLVHKLRGGMRIHIKTSPGNPFTMEFRTEDPTIKDVKSAIEERMGIPVKEQRLIFSGEVIEYDDSATIEDCGITVDSSIRLVRLPVADKVVDIAAALSKDKGRVGNQAETVCELPEVGSKRASVDYSSANPRQSERGLSSNGANRIQGMESFWDEEDFGLAWRRSRSLISPYDTSRFESKSPHMLIESVANECVRVCTSMQSTFCISVYILLIPFCFCCRRSMSWLSWRASCRSIRIN